MSEATDKQWDFLFNLKDRLGEHDFYEAVESVRGDRRNTEDLSKYEASRIIDLLKDQ